MLVADSSCLIFLAKIGRLNILTKLYGRILIPESVEEEVIGEKVEKGLADVQKLEKLIEEKTIEVQKLSKQEKKEAEDLRQSVPIGRGESEAIILARSVKSKLAIDDLAAAKVARAQGLDTLWTTTIIRRAVQEKLISKKEARKIIEDLVAAGYWIAQDVLLEILHELES